MGDALNSLGFSGNTLYGTGGNNFFSVNTSTGTGTLINSDTGFDSSGDIAWDGSQFFATGTDGNLYSLALNGTSQSIGNTGFNDFFGLAYENKTLYGYRSDRSIYSISGMTGAATLVSTISGVPSDIQDLSATSTEIPTPALLPGLVGMGAAALRKRKQQTAVIAADE